MKFRELLQKYKDGTASPEEIAIVESELEKFEALNDYEYDKVEAEIGVCGSQNRETEQFHYTGDMKEKGTEGSKLLEDSRQFALCIQNEVRRTFNKVAITVGICVLVIVLFLVFGLSPMVKSFNYDPTELVWKGAEDEIIPNRLTVDLSAYSELFIPHKKYDSVYCVSHGFGKYYFTASECAWRPEAESHASVAGEITRNNMQLFTPDLLTPVYSGIMGLSNLWKDDLAMCGYLPEEALSDIKSLNNNMLQEAYVTFNSDLSYAECEKLVKKYELYDPWYGVRLRDGNGKNAVDIMGFGFINSIDGFVYENNNPLNAEYPALLYEYSGDVKNSSGAVEGESDNVKVREEYFKTHFTSMITYLSQQETFISMMPFNQWIYPTYSDKIVKYVNDNGLQIYGMAVFADKDTLIKLCEDENVYGVLLADEI